MMAEDGRRIVSVTELNEYLKLAIENDVFLRNVYIKGEISNFTNHRTGHLYFTLKDEGGCISAVMFKFSAAKLKFVPEAGMKVICGGRVSVFVKSGQYQIYVDTMEPDGIGALYVAYEQLKKKLTAEGLFDESKKRPLPKIPLRVGVITSPTGAAVRDIINILGRRFPYARVTLFPSLVQGDGAAPNLIEGMKYFNETNSVDVIIIGRGGGSIEELGAFNDEALVRCVASSRIPTVSAVGHETDFTLCDFAADRRAPTPSAAAELCVPDSAELAHKFDNVLKRLELIETQRLKMYREKLKSLSSSRVLVSPMNFIDDKRMALGVLETRLYDKASAALEMNRARLQRATAKLEALSPLAVISRGYSAVFADDGKLIKSVEQANVGDKISFMMTDGKIFAEIKNVERNEENG